MNSYKQENPAGLEHNTLDDRNRALVQDNARLELRATTAEQKAQALATALESARVGYWEWNPETGEFFVDRQWAAISGHSPEDFINPDITVWQNLCHPDDRETAIQTLLNCTEGKQEFFELSLRVHHKNGEWLRVLDRGKAYRYDSNGRAANIAGSRIALQDQTEHDTSPHHNGNQISDDNKPELRSLIANIPGVVYHINASGKSTIISNQPSSLIAPQASDPALPDVISLVYPDDHQKVASSCSLLKTGKHSLTLVYRIITAQNTVRWVEDHRTSIFSEDGLYTGINGILCDISDRIASQEEALRLESQIQKSQRLETIGTLAGGVAHDFNNILTPIIGYAEMGLATLSEDEPLHEYLTEIMNAAERAQKLIAQILTFSRSQQGKPSPLNLQSSITETIRLISPTLPSSISIEQQIDASCRNVMADPSQIHQVIVNLCTNAIHAMEETGGTLKIELKEISHEAELSLRKLNLQEGTVYAELSVSDTGTGMDEETLARIFEPFFTTKTIDKGTGLGLSVIHGIITRANGRIYVDSTKGKGATVHIYLPVIEDSHHFQHEKHPGIIKQSGSVLFVDDEPSAVQMMTIMMTKLGFRIKAEQSPVEALKIFSEHPDQFDLVITDLTMPEMTGIQLAGELHKISPAIPVILMTGYGKIIDHDTPLSYYGISRLLKKPVKLVQLASAVNEVLSVTNTQQTP
jgi:signal transduction histidine kinase/CheY-like chemotaxis protein